MSDGSVTIKTILDNSDFQKGIKDLTNIGKKGLKTLGVAIGTVTAGFTAMGAYATKVGSDFEAEMSKVQAISGATGDELDKLTEKAKEMGAKTKFSATESAEAFQYMAMAGWKTGDMLNGIEGIMNLASASGENLASVSDIVTDALTAFGLEAKDSAHFADVLAKASSNSNTNVSMMGATFKYVAPIAGSLKYSIEDTAVAIGLMANAGIKGEQAGTALRSMLTRLVKPPKEASIALDKLGVSAINSDGTMKPLSQTLQELREKFKKLDDSQKASYASSIAGTEAMSGMLAIVNASNNDFQKLTQSINNADGASLEMANTMNNNLQGATTIFKSNVESLGVAIYDKFKGPATKGVQSLTKSMEDLTKSATNGKLSKSIDKLANSFGKLVSKSGKFIEKTLPKFIDMLTWVIDHGDSIVKVIGSMAGAMVAFKTASKVNSVIKDIKAIVQPIVLATKATQGATTAQKLWNLSMTANPIGVVIVAITALAGAITYLRAKQIEERSSLDGVRDSLNSQKEKWEELRETREKALEQTANEITISEKLANELSKITDENGQIKDGYETRAKYIVGELNSALGTEMKVNGKIIEQYKEMKDKIQELITAKKGESVLSAYKDEYAEALKEESKGTENLINLQKQLQGKYSELATAKGKERAELLQDIQLINKSIGEQTEQLSQYGYTIQNYENLQTANVSGSAQAIDEAITQMGISWEKAKQNCENSIESQIIAQTKNVSVLKQCLKEAKEANDTYQVDVLSSQLEGEEKQLNNLSKSLAEQMSTIEEATPQQIEAWKKMADEGVNAFNIGLSLLDVGMQTEIMKATGVINSDISIQTATSEQAKKATLFFQQNLNMEDSTKEEITSVASLIQDDETIRNTTKELMAKAIDEFDKSPEARKNALNTITGYLNGLTDDEKRELLKQAGIENIDIVLEELNKGELSEENGRNILKGLWNGLSDGSWQGKILGTAANLARKVNEAFTGKSGWDMHSPSKKMKKYAEYYIQPISDVMKNKEGKIVKVSEELAEKVNKAFSGVDVNRIYEKMRTAVDIETQGFNSKVIAQANLNANKENTKTVTNNNGNTINNTQNFYEKSATPYEEQKQAKQQLRRLTYGL